jgi:hypothetical protein
MPAVKLLHLAAAICFVIAALVAFGFLSSINAEGAALVGLAFWAGAGAV